MASTAATPEAFDLLMQGSLVLAQIEANGIRIDVDYLDRTIQETAVRIKQLQEELRADSLYQTWRKQYCERTKLGSREQLGTILFAVLKLPYRHDFTATGRFRADERVLAEIDLPFVKNFLQLEDLRKLKNTFLEGIRRETVDGFLHPFFHLHTVEPYRGSSSEINFQNLPTRDAAMGKAVRQCFVPRTGRVLVEIDYVGIEVRIAACYHQDPVMLEYINDQTKDMHRDAAAECYLVQPAQVTKQMRYCAKNQFVFPQFYRSYYIDCARNLWEAIDKFKLEIGREGSTPLEMIGTLAQRESLPLKKHLTRQGIRELGACNPKLPPRSGTFEHHIKAVQDDFWGRRFQVYARWRENWYARYLETGDFHTLTGFRCAGIYRRNEVINYPVQGSAFHCLLWSLIHLQQRLSKRKMKTKLVGQVHDSLLADVPEDEVQEYIYLAKEVMTKQLPRCWSWIMTPLAIECECSDTNWYAKQLWQEVYRIWQPKN